MGLITRPGHDHLAGRQQLGSEQVFEPHPVARLGLRINHLTRVTGRDRPDTEDRIDHLLSAGIDELLVPRDEAATREQLRKQRYAIAWELHDTVAHDLSLISMNLQEAGIRGRVDAKELEPLLEACDAAISHLRGILVLMRLDGSVDESRTDSIGSLDQECRRAMGRLTRHGFVADYSSEGPVGELPQATQRALGKLCYEATSNVIKHGDPTGPVTMRVDADPGSHAAQFTLSNTVLAGRRSGAYTPMGIAGMRNRIEAVGGRLHVGADGDQWLTMASVPGRGGITLNEEAP